MASPIKPTSVLESKVAERFYKSLKEAKYSPEKEAKLARVRETYNKTRGRWNQAATK